jgi:hypothetical protein
MQYKINFLLNTQLTSKLDLRMTQLSCHQLTMFNILIVATSNLFPKCEEGMLRVYMLNEMLGIKINLHIIIKLNSLQIITKTKQNQLTIIFYYQICNNILLIYNFYKIKLQPIKFSHNCNFLQGLKLQTLSSIIFERVFPNPPLMTHNYPSPKPIRLELLW